MLHKAVVLNVGTTVAARRVRLRTPRSGGLNRVSHATVTADNVSRADTGDLVLQLSENEQHLQTPPTTNDLIIANESGVATWMWISRILTSGLATTLLTSELLLGVELPGDLVFLGLANQAAVARVDIYYEEVAVSTSDKLWVVRQAPRRFPGAPQSP